MITSRPQINKQAGFTLVEMLVAVAIFVIVAMVVTSVFITLANANRKAQSIRLVMDNLNFAIDSVALKMREATNYDCVLGDDVDSCDNVSFITADSDSICYYLKDDEVGGKTIGRIFTSTTCSGGTPITAEQVDITDFMVLIDRPTIPTGAGRARATLLIKGVAGSGKTASSFNIQTTVSERNFSGNVTP